MFLSLQNFWAEHFKCYAMYSFPYKGKSKYISENINGKVVLAKAKALLKSSFINPKGFSDFEGNSY